MSKTVRVIREKGIPLPEITLADASAIKALERGDASPQQQKIALDWIVKKAGMIGGIEFDINSDRLSQFNGGRRFVATTVVYILSNELRVFDNNPTKQLKEKL